jgi:hypothetical protein
MPEDELPLEVPRYEEPYSAILDQVNNYPTTEEGVQRRCFELAPNIIEQYHSKSLLLSPSGKVSKLGHQKSKTQ